MSEFLQSNWLWILLGGGVLFFLFARGRGGMGCGGSHGSHSDHAHGEETPTGQQSAANASKRRGGCC